ncbi:MAG: hypothetical protein H6844_00300 [Alphaproteobacteria bacterium]|nr:hypothetical protein [Alphaproteobacteria bacterium]
MANLYVGAGQAYQTLSAAVAASEADDTIYLAAGTYYDDPVVVEHSLTLVGLGDGARLVWTGGDIGNGKGILVAQTSVENLVVDNLEFVGARVADRNGAGIRFQGANLTVLNSGFIDNQDGILATANPDAVISVSGSSFRDNGAGDGKSHAIYAANVAEVTVAGSTFVGTHVGHHIKSVAAATTVVDSVLDDADGQTSFSIEASLGGDLLVRGNTFSQGATGNANFIYYSTDRGGVPGSVTVADNTFANADNIGRILANGTDTVATVTGNSVTNAAGARTEIASGLFAQSNNTIDGVAQDASAFDDGAVVGTASADTMIGTAADDIVNGGAGDDVLSGRGGRDLLLGDAGHDALYAGADASTLLGGTGDDLLVGGGGADFLAGNDGADTLIGHGSADILYGGDGADLLVGGNGADTINGGGGIDTAVFAGRHDQYALLDVSTSTTSVWTVAATAALDDATGTDLLQNVERIAFSDGYVDTATGAFVAGVVLADYAALSALADPTGGQSSNLDQFEGTTVTPPASVEPPPIPTGIGTDAGHETIEGTAGDDVLATGGGYWDRLAGGSGDDAYIVEVNQTTVAEAVGGGTDTVYSRAAYLAVASEVENFVLLDGAGGLTANRYDNHIAGNDGDNRLNGNGGDDTILGMGGDDTLIGGRGNDSIDGGDGVDTAEFSGDAADYRLSLDGDGSIRVEVI